MSTHHHLSAIDGTPQAYDDACHICARHDAKQREGSIMFGPNHPKRVKMARRFRRGLTTWGIPYMIESDEDDAEVYVRYDVADREQEAAYQQGKTDGLAAIGHPSQLRVGIVDQPLRVWTPVFEVIHGHAEIRASVAPVGDYCVEYTLSSLIGASKVGP